MANNNLLQQFVIIALTILGAFYIQELPTSNTIQMILPEWPFLLTLYFSVSTRYFFGVIAAFAIGMIQDVFLGVETIGLHAGIYALCAFIILANRLRFKHLNIFIKTIFIGGLALLKIILLTMYNTILYSVPTEFWSFLSIAFSMLAWPGIYFFFQFFARRHQ